MYKEEEKLLINLLNTDFSREEERKRSRKIVFWYDEDKEYQEFIKELEVEGTKIIIFENNSFYIRYYIEKINLKDNIVVYFPFERPRAVDNELLDIESANKDLLFKPDAITMKIKSLNLTRDEEGVIKKNKDFFNNKKREDDFREFPIEKKNSQNIDYIITAVLLGIKTINNDEIIKHIIKEYLLKSKKYEDLFKFGNEEFILNLFNQMFSSKMTSPEELGEALESLIFTYFASDMNNFTEIDKYGRYVLKRKATNVYVFIDITTRKFYEDIAEDIEIKFGIEDILKKMNIDDYINADAFPIIDKYILQHIISQLNHSVNNYDRYLGYIEKRENKFWFEKFKNEYMFLYYYINFLIETEKRIEEIKTYDFDEFVNVYVSSLSMIDTLYRKSYLYFDNIKDKDEYIALKELLENTYVNEFMGKLSMKWSESVEKLKEYDSQNIILQNKFYNEYIMPFKDKKDRNIIIISDAFRYECGKELNEKLNVFAENSELTYMLSLIPSYTKLGMAALLPNTSLSRVKDSDDILVDGKKSSSLKDREKILQNTNEDSIAITYTDLYEMTKTEWKKLFSGKRVVYIYHDVIDKTGEHNEDQVFEASEKAIDEILTLIQDLHTTFTGISAFITADHGYFYKRGNVKAHEKTDKEEKAIKQKTRYSYTDKASGEEGIISIHLDYIFGEDSGYVNIPKGNLIYARQGSGFNYVHGGILPQEVIIPLIKFKSGRTSVETSKVGIALSSLSNRITNSITRLSFIQDSKVDDEHQACRYTVHFEDDESNKISDVVTIIADFENENVNERIFEEKFVFKDINYNREKEYYLIITEEETGIIKSKDKFIIDIAIANNFNF